ncbi:MAG: MiaB/RimO family radical SAM methylthiotransferase, partial [Elusimicrobiaceae bacterium]|nr:MiaB/RimO family radical SAM methylthiotransferase [Elusimicrobiaceae bacterium]
MNEADSEEMLLHLFGFGYQKTDVLSEADLVLINTCTIRDHAEHRALSYLGRLAKWKAEKRGRKIIFAGCAAERLGKKVQKRFPQADIVCGAKSLDKFPSVLEKSSLFKPVKAAKNLKEDTKRVTGQVSIMRGCSCKCSYCIVPYVRGEASSIAPEIILENCCSKAKNHPEIMLLGQTVNAYNYKGFTFSKLLEEVCKIPEVKRVRFLSPHPVFIKEDFYKVVQDNKKIAKHLHLPLQSGSTRVLKDMKRLYSAEEYFEIIKNLKQLDFLISTDIIVGYPTETEEDFKQTLALVKKCGFSFAYCFKFSPRAGTPAAGIKEISQEVVENRLNILLNGIRECSAVAYKSRVGQKEEILFETKNSGRTSGNLWYRTTTPKQPGTLEEILIKDSNGKI